MLVNMNEVLRPAIKNHYAVGLFNAVNLELARGIINAAEAKRSPVIMGTAEVLLPYGPLDEVSYYLIPMAKKASVPVVVHLDHGLTYDTCIKALELGFSSVMYDCSTDSYEENVRKVKEMADIAHKFGATIEGELGHVGDNEGSAEGDSHLADPSAFFTDVSLAKDFVDRTGVDALAVAIGTAHGVYKTKPQLNLDRLCEIRQRIDTPLVLHGGSGLSDDDFINTVKNGINKVNIFTDLYVAGKKAMIECTGDYHDTRDEKVKAQLNLKPETIRHIEKDIAACEKEMDDDAESIITNERYNYITAVTQGCYKKKKAGHMSLSDRIDSIVTHRILALPIFVRRFICPAGTGVLCCLIWV